MYLAIPSDVRKISVKSAEVNDRDESRIENVGGEPLLYYITGVHDKDCRGQLLRPSRGFNVIDESRDCESRPQSRGKGQSTSRLERY